MLSSYPNCCWCVLWERASRTSVALVLIRAQSDTSPELHLSGSFSNYFINFFPLTLSGLWYRPPAKKNSQYHLYSCCLSSQDPRIEEFSICRLPEKRCDKNLVFSRVAKWKGNEEKARILWLCFVGGFPCITSSVQGIIFCNAIMGHMCSITSKTTDKKLVNQALNN